MERSVIKASVVATATTVHCCDSHLHCADKEAGSNGVSFLSTTGAAHPPHTQDSPPSDQQVHSKVSLRRAVDAVQRWRVRVFEPAVQGGKPARCASSLRTWRWRVRRSPCPSCPTTHPPYVPRPSALDHLDRDMLNPTSDLLSHCHRRVYGVGCGLSERRGLRGGA